MKKSIKIAATLFSATMLFANAAFAIRTLEPEVSVAEACRQAEESIVSGRALASFQRFVELNK